jgi:putative multiple sugar transport system permease protein
MGFITEMKDLLKKNIRDYGMYIALVVIMAVFAVLTDGTFISSRNISKLIDATGYIAVLAVGMTLVIVIRHIDLSVGFAAGFLGAVAAILLTSAKLPVIVVIPIILVLGVVVGLLTGFFVARVGIPAFVASLAGMLIYRGALLQVTQKTGTIIVPNASFNAIGNGYIPDIAILPNNHFITLVLGALAIVFMVISESNTRRNKVKYNFEVVSGTIFSIKLVFVSLIIAYIAFILSQFNGLSWTTVIVIVVTAIYHFVTNRTVVGRHIYAVGGNPEAAKLSGISVKAITFLVFGSMGLLTAMSGILYTARLQSATTTAGTLFELDAIAAAYVGGVSAAGGVGKVTGSIIGALVMASLISGMNLMGVDISWQYIIRGAVLVLAVVFDVMTRNKK